MFVDASVNFALHERLMFTVKYKNIFRSRWYALLWALGFMWFAFEFVDMRGTHHTTAAADTDGIEQATAALNAGQ